MGCFYGPGYYVGGFWWAGHLIFWGLVILGIFYLLKYNKGYRKNDALNILEREYALGRISREEFLNKKKDLK
jgi:putative membrane protein